MTADEMTKRLRDGLIRFANDALFLAPDPVVSYWQVIKDRAQGATTPTGLANMIREAHVTRWGDDDEPDTDTDWSAALYILSCLIDDDTRQT